MVRPGEDTAVRQLVLIVNDYLIVTVWPMLSGPRACKTDCTCRIGSPFQSMTMSPW